MDQVSENGPVAAYTSATPLGIAANTFQPGNVSDTSFRWLFIWNCLLGSYRQRWRNVGYFVLLGAALLIGTGVGSWRTMLSAVVGGVFMATIFVCLQVTLPFPFLGLNALCTWLLDLLHLVWCLWL